MSTFWDIEKKIKVKELKRLEKYDIELHKTNDYALSSSDGNWLCVHNVKNEVVGFTRYGKNNVFSILSAFMKEFRIKVISEHEISAAEEPISWNDIDIDKDIKVYDILFESFEYTIKKIDEVQQ